MVKVKNGWQWNFTDFDVVDSNMAKRFFAQYTKVQKQNAEEARKTAARLKLKNERMLLKAEKAKSVPATNEDLANHSLQVAVINPPVQKELDLGQENWNHDFILSLEAKIVRVLNLERKMDKIIAELSI